jgi:exodeoxyribonuclease V gamma subunit
MTIPVITLYTSNRLEILAEKLADLLRHPLSSPLEPEIILVQSKGMERWVSMELARHNGICANCRFPFPNHFLNSLFQEALPDLQENSPFTPEILTWKVMKILPSLLEEKGFGDLRRYLSEGVTDLKLFQLAERVAGLYDQYLLFRPEMVLGWEKGKEGHWQALLWREVIKEMEGKHWASLKAAFLAEIRKPGQGLKSLPKRVAVFGISALPPYHLEILASLSHKTQVNLFLMNPCREYWGDLLTDRETRKIKERARIKKAVAGDLHLEKGNALLGSMGMLGRDFFELVSNLETVQQEFFFKPEGKSLLSAIQADILDLRNRSAGEADKKSLDRKDDSIQIHSCHSPMREVEVLQDRLLSLFEANPTLQPKDVLIMTPDITIYSPFIQAVFSLPPEDPRWIPFRIADRGLRQESPLVNAFLSILDFPGSRFGVSQVLALLESPEVQKKFSLTEDDLERIKGWVRDTRIRWGVDGEARKKLGLPGFKENTWRAGLERMLLGVALPRQGEKMYKDILPYDLIEGSGAESLGHFLAFCESLFTFAEKLSEPRSLKEWEELLQNLLDDFFSPYEESERDLLFIRRVLAGLVNKQELSGFDQPVSLGIIKSHLTVGLESEGFGFGFLTGSLTFCAMLPMRSIPFRIIVLLGMNDDAYPRQTRPLGFDLMAQNPKIGDRSRRLDDRYLFLETLLSAREKLHISYVGQSHQDNSSRPPSVLVSELLDTLTEGFEIPEGMIIKHHLQAFSPEYFEKGGKLFSYSRDNLEGALGALNSLRKKRPFISSALPDPGPEWKTVELSRLCSFFSHPARFLLNRRLGIYLGEEESLLEETEPFEVTGLDKYLLEQAMVEKGLEGQNLSDLFMSFKAEGNLPLGVPGEVAFQETCREIGPFLKRLSSYRRGGGLAPLAVDLCLGDFRLTGRVENIFADNLVHHRYTSMKAGDRLRIWIHHLVLNRINPPDYPCEAILVCQDGICHYASLEDSEAILQDLLTLYWQGLKIPLPFFPSSSWTYTQASTEGKDRDQALRSAVDCWQGNEFRKGEGADPYYQLCFGEIDPFSPAFESIAETVFGPLIRWEKR